MILMEKVMCIKCGSIGYTASPERVNCSECGGRHKTIQLDYEDWKPGKEDRILSPLGMMSG